MKTHFTWQFFLLPVSLFTSSLSVLYVTYFSACAMNFSSAQCLFFQNSFPISFFISCVKFKNIIVMLEMLVVNKCDILHSDSYNPIFALHNKDNNHHWDASALLNILQNITGFHNAQRNEDCQIHFIFRHLEGKEKKWIPCLFWSVYERVSEFVERVNK